MLFKEPIQLITSAAASDGGSLAIILGNSNERELLIILDRAIGTTTYNKLVYENKILSSI